MSFASIKNIIPPRFPLRRWYHHLRAYFWAHKLGRPGKKLRVIGITGTDGKTTTTEMLSHILRKNGAPVASASTVSYCFNNETCLPPSKKTSQDCQEINRFLKYSLKKGCQVAILEVSSVALDQGRFNCVRFDAVGLTNITPEELRYHGNFQKYRQAKKLLFQKCRGTHVLPGKQEFQDFAHLISNRKIIWSTGHTRNFPNSELLIAEHIRLRQKGSSFTIKNVPFELNIPGDFNIENALVAIGLALSQGLDLQNCTEALETFTGVPGRLQSIDNSKGLHIFVDYALTPNAFERLLQTARKNFPKSRIIIVFGCAGGTRDRKKRPILGQIAGNLADYTIITEDENYTEAGEKITTAIKKGVPKKAKYQVILDRRQAIAHALEYAHKGDVILIPGMGAENSRNMAGTEIPWSDADVIKEELKKLT